MFKAKPIKAFILVFGSIMIMAASSSSKAETMEKDNTATEKESENLFYLDLEHGRVTIELFPDLAPNHVERITTLAAEGFYQDVIFHRVIDGFMAQTGDPTGTGRGGSDYPDLDAEFSEYKYKRGTIGMARTSDPNSANSQFFICYTDTGCSFLTGQYTVWGQVVKGMEHVDKIAKGEPPANPTKIVHMQTAFEKDDLVEIPE